MIQEFKEFIAKGNVVMLAVGFIMGVKALALTGPASDTIHKWTKNMTFVGEGEGGYQRGGGLKVMQDLLQKDPDLNILVSMSDDMALGYKQLQRVEEAWRSMKSGLRLRPVFHWAVHRIHAHVAITVLALLLERVAEHACGDTWRNIRDDLKRIQLAQLLSPHGRVWQVTEPTPEAAKRLKSLQIKPPPPILSLA